MPKISFKTNYPTQWGERVVVTGNIPELGNGDLNAALRLEYKEGDNWEQNLRTSSTEFEYQYVVVNENSEELNREWGEYRTFSLTKKEGERAAIALKDTWRAKSHPENTLYNAAFLKVIFNPKKHKVSQTKLSERRSAVRFQIHAPKVEKHQRLCVLGNIDTLGSWGANKPLLLGNEDYPLWSGTVSFISGLDIEYKYGIYDIEEKEIIFVEEGENRTLPSQETKGKDLTIIHDHYFNHPKGDWKGVGIAMPVFALRSQNGLGIGEFTDIKLLVDWATQVGMKMVQILPINDTSASGTWVDSYPYAAISVYALHPMYLNIEAINGFDKVVDSKTYQALQLQLNALETVDYELVMKHKTAFARQIFDATKSKFLKDKSFKKFFAENQHWLQAYGYFCILRDQYNTPDFNQWEADSEFSKERMEKACAEKSEHFDDIAFYYFLQYQLDQQLQEVSDYARKHRTILKGDIPIGIYRYSVDAWTKPELYHMDAQAGAPPDQFSDDGQNWGFPTYNWEVMAEDNYAWWQDRLKTLSKYFDAFRIDHILGFFRIWQVPFVSTSAKLGHFYPAIPVTVNEFYQRRIGFDFDRFCKPFITEEHLQELFGEETDYVKNTFLKAGHVNRFAFQETFDTQRKVDNYFKDTANQSDIHFKKDLLQLHTEVLFIEEKGSNQQAFHPRISFQNTRSFAHFPYHIQEQLEGLYHDYFYNRQEDLWATSAMTKLPTIKAATDMFICAEDLGMIPACVPQVMKDLDMLTLEIQSMPKKTQDFLQAEHVPYYSVCSPSTHDSAPIRLWWTEELKKKPGYIQRFYNHELKHDGLPPAVCSAEILQQVVQQHLDFESMWAVFPMSDLLGMSETLSHPNPQKERINEPDKIPHYWRYRMHLTMETLMENEAFAEQLKEMIEKSGRD
ncbi:MAG: 4-alpha-glucanotransferase [Chitinophagales bacterium]